MPYNSTPPNSSFNIPLFSVGLRPFFSLCSLWAIVAILIFVSSLFLNVPLNSKMDLILWHRHEMIYGFTGAAIAGFLLTAIPNWTGREGVSPKSLAILASIWILGRVGNLFSVYLGYIISISFDVSFFLILGIIILNEIMIAKNRNLPIAIMVFLLAFADLYDHLTILLPELNSGINLNPMLGTYFALSVITIMVSLIGGRVIPNFTGNYLKKTYKNLSPKDLPPMMNRFDFIVIIATIVAMISWVIGDNIITALLLIIAGALQLIRLIRWKFYKTIADPLVLILHIAYFMLPLGLLFLGLYALSTVINVPSLAALTPAAGIHIITMGTMSLMILAIMTRAGRGHTGRALKASPMAIASYISLSLAIFFRIAAALQIINYPLAILITASLWIIAFLLFAIEYIPYFILPRPKDK